MAGISIDVSSDLGTLDADLRRAGRLALRRLSGDTPGVCRHRFRQGLAVCPSVCPSVRPTPERRSGRRGRLGLLARRSCSGQAALSVPAVDASRRRPGRDRRLSDVAAAATEKEELSRREAPADRRGTRSDRLSGGAGAGGAPDDPQSAEGRDRVAVQGDPRRPVGPLEPRRTDGEPRRREIGRGEERSRRSTMPYRPGRLQGRQRRRGSWGRRQPHSRPSRSG